MKYTIEVNDTFKPLLNCHARYQIIYGGAGSGKSFFIATRETIRLLGKERHNLLVARKTGKSNRDSTFALFKQVISKYGLSKYFTIYNGDLRIRCFNDNEVIFVGLDDVEKLKSVTFATSECTTIWVEEASEITEEDFNQLDVRLRGGNSKKEIIVSFNPIDVSHWIKRRLVDKKDDDRYVVHHSTYLDNRFLDKEYTQTLESFKETDAYFYKVYCQGLWGTYHESAFPSELIDARMKVVPAPVKKGYFEYDKEMNYQWIDDPQGYISLYEMPLEDHQYAIGGDTASGVGSDFSVAQVFDAASGKQVAVLHNRMDTDLYAKQMFCLGKFYNYGLIAIETNFDLYPIKWLEEKGYTYQYVREQQDTFTHSIKKAFGFRTDSYTRPRILSQLIEISREHTDLFNDYETLHEMMTFVRSDKGRLEAEENCHDDLVLAAAIGIEAINQVLFKTKRKKIERSSEEDFFDYGG